MSGIELASLILGAVPVLVAAVDLSRSGYQKSMIPFRKRRYVGMLTNALLLQRQTVSETTRLLVVHSGCLCNDHALQTQLDDDLSGYLEDENVREQILDSLGEKNHAALTGSLQEIHIILKRVAKKLSGMVPASQDQSDDLLGIIEANQAAKKQQADVMSRVKLMLRSNDIKQSIDDLDAATSSLHRFSQLVLMNRPGPSSGNSSHKAVRLTRAFRQIRGFATDLYAALCLCCRGGICHVEHEADLFLESWVDAVNEILRPTCNEGAEYASILAFRLIFTARLLAPAQSLWHELPIQVLKYERDPAVDLHPAKSRVTIVVPEITDVEETASTPIKSGLTPVGDFCATIAAAKQGGKSITFVLSGSSQMGTVITKERTILSQDSLDRITLKAILSDSISISHGIGFTLRLRMLLALRLASNLLQLSQTPWMGQSWSKETVYFLLRPTKKGGRPLADLNRAFMSAAIARPDASPAVCCANAEPKVVLLDLGILLLEIWHQTTLEARFCLDESPAGYYLRLVRAVEWLDDGDNPPPDLYERAISYCIRGMLGSEARLASWDANELWHGVCKNVVEPLSQNCKQWR